MTLTVAAFSEKKRRMIAEDLHASVLVMKRSFIADYKDVSPASARSLLTLSYVRMSFVFPVKFPVYAAYSPFNICPMQIDVWQIVVTHDIHIFHFGPACASVSVPLLIYMFICLENSSMILAVIPQITWSLYS